MYWFSLRVTKEGVSEEAIRAFLDSHRQLKGDLMCWEEASRPHRHITFQSRCKEQSVRGWIKTELGLKGNSEYSLKEIPDEANLQRARQYVCKGADDTRSVAGVVSFTGTHDISALNAAYWREWDEKHPEVIEAVERATSNPKKPIMVLMLESVMLHKDKFLDETGAILDEVVYRECYRWFGKFVRLGINRYKVEDAYELVKFHLNEDAAYKSFVGNKFRPNNFSSHGYTY